MRTNHRRTWAIVVSIVVLTLLHVSWQYHLHSVVALLPALGLLLVWLTTERRWLVALAFAAELASGLPLGVVSVAIGSAWLIWLWRGRVQADLSFRFGLLSLLSVGLALVIMWLPNALAAVGRSGAAELAWYLPWFTISVAWPVTSLIGFITIVAIDSMAPREQARIMSLDGRGVRQRAW